MKIVLATIGAKRAASPAASLRDDFLQRCERYAPVEHQTFVSAERLLQHIERASTRTRAILVACSSEGNLMTSEQIAAAIGDWRDRGVQELTLAIGPADGWPPAAEQRADRVLSFGRITLAHELASVVLAEQIYRALTILAGHPYHCGH